MSGWLNKLHQFFITIDPSAANSGQWRLIAASGILVIGLFLSEIMFRTVTRRIQASLKNRDRDPAAWNITGVLPSARLAATAWLLQLAGSLVAVSEQLGRLLQAVEALLLALAAIIVIFWLVDKLANLRQALPADLQERFPEKSLAKLNRLLRLAALLGVAIVFTYSQRTLLPERLWQHSAWRYLLIVMVVVLVYLATLQIGAFLTRLAIVLKESKENVRLMIKWRVKVWKISAAGLRSGVWPTSPSPMIRRRIRSKKP